MLGLPLALLLTLAGSASVAAREPPFVAGNFFISNFSAFHQFDSNNSYVSFTVATDFGLPSTTCGGHLSSANHKIPNFPVLSCDGLPWMWDLNKNDSTGIWGVGAIYPSMNTYYGTYYFPKSADRYFRDPSHHKGKKYEVLIPVSETFNTTAYGVFNGP